MIFLVVRCGVFSKFISVLMCNRLLREMQSEGALTAEQSLRVKEWLCSVEEERSGLTTASGPDSGIEDSGALRGGRPSIRNHVCFFQSNLKDRLCQTLPIIGSVTDLFMTYLAGHRSCRGEVEP